MTATARRSTVIVAIASITAAASAAWAPAEVRPISAAELLGRIQSARSIAEGGRTDPSQAAMASVRSALGLPVAVRLGDDVVSLPTDAYLEELDGSAPAEFSDAISHLDALAASTTAAVEPAAIDRARVGRALTEAYAGVPSESLLAQYIRYAREFVGGLLARWIGSLDASHGLGSVLSWGALALLLAAVAAVIVRLRSGFVPEPTTGRRPFDSVTDWRAVAERAIASGDAAAAVIALYHVLLDALAARGVIAADPAVTAGECRAAVARALPAAYATVAFGTAAFESIEYGGRDPTMADIEALRAATRAVLAS